ncbi:MAG: hypothetical protein ACRDYY_17080 [Acidimicrobiales bacterium]
MTEYDLTVDFMDMTDDRHLWTRIEDARPGFAPTVGSYITIGCEDADPAVAQVLTIDPDDNIELDVLPGGIGAHLELLTSA